MSTSPEVQLDRDPTEELRSLIDEFETKRDDLTALMARISTIAAEVLANKATRTIGALTPEERRQIFNDENRRNAQEQQTAAGEGGYGSSDEEQ